jgi:hypothetical protein
VTRPLFENTVNVAPGMRVRFIWDYARGEAIVREGAVERVVGMHHVAIRYASSRVPGPGREPRMLRDDRVDVRRILEVLA